MPKVTPWLWFDTEGEEAAEFYTSVFPNSRIVEVTRYWNALSEGGEEGPCGWLKDRYGLSWQIVPKALQELLVDPDREKAQRVKDAMLQMGKIDVAELERAAEAA